MLRSVLVGVIRFYQVAISPWMPAACRYQPSCSQYALEAIRLHGSVRGGWMAVRRLGRCHPWGGSGYDPVPPLPGAPEGPHASDRAGPRPEGHPKSADETSPDEKSVDE